MKESKRVSTLSYSGQHGDNGIVLKCRHVVLVTGSSRGEVELKGGEVKEETVKLLGAGLGWAGLGWAGLGWALREHFSTSYSKQAGNHRFHRFHPPRPSSTLIG